MKTCPECAEEIKLEAKVCRYCGTTFALTRVGYCIRCHKVVATNDLGVCAICGSRLIDVRLESWEVSGPTVGAEKKEAAPAGAAAVAPIPGAEAAVAVAPVSAPIPGAVAPVVPVKEPDTAEDVAAEVASAAAPEAEPEAKEELEAEEPELGAKEPEPEPKPPEPVPKPPEPELPSAPSPPPGPPPGVAWAKKEPVAETKPPEKEPEAEAAAPEEATLTPKPPPITTSETVAERLAAFGRREPVTPTPTPPVGAPPPGPPVTPPPGPPGGIPVRPPVSTTPPVTPARPATPAAPVSGPGAGGPPAAAAAPPVKPEAEPRPESAKEKPAAEKPAEPVAAPGTRLGIVPSLAQRAAYPFYLLSVIAVLAMWLINYYWDHNLQGTTKTGSQTLSHFIVDTYGNGGMTLVSWQLGAIAILCALLIPTRLLPKGWFRQRGVAKEYTKELRAELGVDMVFKQKWYFQKMMLALALWAIAIGYLVATIVRKGSIVLQTGGYVTIAALLIGFACSAVLAARRQQLVAIDEAGRIKH